MPQRRHRRGTPSGGQFAAGSKDEAGGTDVLNGDGEVPAVASGRQARLQARLDQLAELNDRRLLLTVDFTLPEGIVRCVDCGRFVGEADPAHACPQPLLVEGGFSEAWASTLAHAGFGTPAVVATWRRTIEQMGPKQAGLWKHAGVGPLDAARLAGQGVDPADLYQQGGRTLSEQVDAVAARMKIRERDWNDFRAGDRAWEGGRNDKDVKELAAVGHHLDRAIDDRLDRWRDDARQATWKALQVGQLTDGQIDTVLESEPWNSNQRDLKDALAAAGVPEDVIEVDELPAGWSALPGGSSQRRYGVIESLMRDVRRDWRQARPEATLEVLSEHRNFGGDLAANVTAGAKDLVAAATPKYPTDWIEASNRQQLPLKVEKTRGRNGRAYYRHKHRPNPKKKVESVAYERRRAFGSGHQRIRVATGLTPDEQQQVLKERHPEAFDQALWERMGGEPTEDDYQQRAGRVSNIRDVTYDPESGWMTYRCDDETIGKNTHYTYETQPATSMIRTGGVSDTVHEMGHHMENLLPGVQPLAQAWRRQRWKAHGDQDAIKVGPDSGEWGRPGGFVTDYIGKEYPSGDTEVVSVGMESVMGGAYGSLVGDGGADQQDEEHRAFMLGLLACVGRTDL